MFDPTEDLECGECGREKFKKEHLTIHGPDAVDIHCPDCGHKTQKRWAHSEFDPDSLF